MQLKEVDLVPVPLSTLCGVLQGALSKQFKECSVEAVECPDLQQAPWKLSGSYLGGNPCIADVGGVDNLHYMENNGTSFQLDSIATSVGISSPFILGPGAGTPRQSGGVLSELMVNTNLRTEKNLSKCCKVTTDTASGYQMDEYKSNEIGVLANLLVCEGKPAQVLHVKASTRTGSLNFVSCMRQALAAEVSGCVGLAGVFSIKVGSIKAHVMPDFPGEDMLSGSQVEKWLKFYQMHAPLTCLSVMLSKDEVNAGFRLEHTHFFSEHGDAGHYHYDTSPEDVEYEGYFIQCEKAFRLHPPHVSPNRKAFFK